MQYQKPHGTKSDKLCVKLDQTFVTKTGTGSPTKNKQLLLEEPKFQPEKRPSGKEIDQEHPRLYSFVFLVFFQHLGILCTFYSKVTAQTLSADLQHYCLQPYSVLNRAQFGSV